MNFRDFLLSVLGGGIALGPIVFGVIRQYCALDAVPAKYRALIVAAMTATLSLAAWGVAVWLGYVPTPITPQDTAEAVWTYGLLTGFAAYTSATALHSYTKERGETVS